MRHTTLSLLSFLLCAAPAGARAGGIFVPGYGSSAQPRAGAFVARADDPTALFHNPAGFAKQRGRTTIHIGANLISMHQSFDRAGSYEVTGEDPPLPYEGEPYPEVENQPRPDLGVGTFQGLPLISVATDFGLEAPIGFGFGLVVANGYPERKFRPDYVFDDPTEGPPPQRYDIMKQKVEAAFPSVAVAYSVLDNLDVGARFSWGIVTLEAESAVWGLPGNFEEYVGRDGLFTVEVEDEFVPAWQLGALYRPHPSVEIGASYHSQKTVNAQGTGDATLGSGVELPSGEMDFIVPENEFPLCAAGGTATALKACLNFHLPRTAAIGGRWILRDDEGRERADVELDVQWENWSNASDFEVIVDGKSGLTGVALKPQIIRHGFKDVFSFRLGGSYAVPVGAESRLLLRAGGAYDTETAPTSWTRLDIDGMPRTTLGAGIAWEAARFRIDAGGGAVLEPTRTVDSGCNPTETMPGCDGTGEEAPADERTAPDPIQPINDANNQAQSPFNDGTYEQGYVMFSLGVTTWF